MKLLPTAGEEPKGHTVDLPTGSVRFELISAVVRAIRQHGSEAFGILFVGIAHLLIALLALVLFLSTCHLFGIDLSPMPVTILSALSGVVGWAVGGSIRGQTSSSPFAEGSDCSSVEDDPVAQSSNLIGPA